MAKPDRNEKLPSYAGGRAKDPAPARGSLAVKSNHSAGYRGPYNSNGRFAAELKRSR